MALLFSDNFDRADSATVGNGWDESLATAKYSIVSNTLAASGGASYENYCLAPAAADFSNGYAVVDFDFSSAGVPQLYIRMDGLTPNGYLAYHSGGNFNLARSDGASLTNLDTAAVSLSAATNYRITFTGDGSGLTAVLRNIDTATDLATLTATDATYASGSVALSNNTVGVIYYDNFESHSLVAGPTVTQTDTTPEDGVQQSFTTTGLTGTITAATLGGYDILSLLSDTDPTTATTYTLDISAIEASQGAPRIGQTSTLSITATGGTATTDVVIQPKTGWAEVDLAGTLNKDAGGFLALLDSTLGLTSAVGDIIYYANPNGEVITAAGLYTSDLTTAGQNTPFVIQQGGSATTVATSEGGAFYPYGEAGGSGSKVVQSIDISNLRIGL